MCPICGSTAMAEDLAEANWLPPAAALGLEREHEGWHLSRGACPNCVRRAMLEILMEQGDVSMHDRVQAAYPLNAETAFGVLPTPMRLHADPRYAGRGVTLALIDAGFYPHPDLTRPRNRIRAWVDAAADPVDARYFGPGKQPEWPGWDSGAPSQWHGLMTSSVAAGNGRLSHGLYRGLAAEAGLVLVRARAEDGHIGNEHIARALRWLREHREELGVRVVSISVAGDPVPWLPGNPVDKAVAALAKEGVTVIAAAGNEGVRHLVPPATAPDAITVGGLDDRNNFAEHEVEVWHSNYGEGIAGLAKPELVAPSIWVVAPVLPGSEVARQAGELFARRPERSIDVESRISEMKLVTPHYQHVEGTSFAAPLVASVVACMLEANGRLSPQDIRRILVQTAQPAEGAEPVRQGAGALVPSRAINLALRAEGGPLQGLPVTPHVEPDGISFILLDHSAEQVSVQGSWDGWAEPGAVAERIRPGVWLAKLHPLEPGCYTYKFCVDGVRWMDDPGNPRKSTDKHGGFDSVLELSS